MIESIKKFGSQYLELNFKVYGLPWETEMPVFINTMMGRENNGVVT